MNPAVQEILASSAERFCQAIQVALVAVPVAQLATLIEPHQAAWDLYNLWDEGLACPTDVSQPILRSLYETIYGYLDAHGLAA